MSGCVDWYRVDIIDYGMDIQTAIDFPRSFPENGYLKLEDGYSDKVASELENKGHKIGNDG